MFKYSYNFNHIMADFSEKMIGVIIGILVAWNLIPSIQDSVDNGGLTGSAGTLASLIVFFVVVGILLFVVKTATK